MVHYYLRKHKKYGWEKQGDIYYRHGFGQKESFAQHIMEIFNSNLKLEEIGTKICEINSSFCFVAQKEKYIYLCADRTQSFPILYRVSGEDIVISDSITKLQEAGWCGTRPNKKALEQFASMGVVLGRKTLFDDISVLEAGQIVKINTESGAIEFCDYFMHNHGNYFVENISELSVLLDKAIENVFQRLKENIGERLIVVPLSGGYDSRLVVTSLKNVGIKNVLCISYGRRKDKEVQVAQQLATELGYRWMFVPQTKKEIVQFSQSDKFWKYMKDISNGSAIPYLQNFAIYKLYKNGIIPNNAVIMTGNSGDVLEGDQMPECFAEERMYSRDELVDAILNKHFRLGGRKCASNPEIREAIIRQYKLKGEYDYEEIHNIYEQFNWRERQSQFLFNDGLFYSDFCGLEWFFPLWDTEFVDYWLHVPTKLRYKRKFYYQYVHKEKLKTANDPTLYQMILEMAKNKMYNILSKFYIIKRVAEYELKGDRIWHLLNRKEYWKMLLVTGGVGTNSNTAVIWALLKKCFNIDVQKEVVFASKDAEEFKLK